MTKDFSGDRIFTFFNFKKGSDLMDLFKKCENQERVNLLKERDIYPYFHMLTSKQAPEVVDRKSVV